MDRSSPATKFKLIILVAVVLFGFVAPVATAHAQNTAVNAGITAATVAAKTYGYLDQKATQVKQAVSIIASGPLAWAAWFGGFMIDAVSRVDPLNNRFLNCAETKQGTEQTCLGTAVKNAHNFILNLVNIVFLFLLLVIAISTIAGAERFSVARLLPRLVLAIIFANFGLFVVSQIASISQVLVQGLLGTENLGNTIVQATMVDRVASNGGQLLVWLIPGVNIVAGPLVTFFATILDPLFWYIVAFFIVAMVLVFRLVGLWFLGIAAPIGVAAAVLPSTQQYATLYWRKVIQYAFIGPVMIFFLRLSIIIFTSVKAGPFSSTGAIIADTLGENNPVTTAVAHALALAFAALTLIIGLIVTKKMGVEVANYTIAGFEKAFKFGFKALKVGGKTAATVVGTAAGGAGLAASAATALNLSPKDATLAGTASSTLGGNIKSEFGGKGVMGAVGGFFSKQGEQLSNYKKKDKDLDFTNEYSTQAGNSAVVAEGQKLLDSNPDFTDEIEKNPEVFLARIGAAGDDLGKRAALAFAFAKAGGLTPKNLDEATKGLSEGQVNLIKRQGSNKNALLGIDMSAVPEVQVKELEEFFSRNPFTAQNNVALEDGRVAEAIMSVRKGDLEKLESIMTIDQRRSLGVGVAEAAEGKDVDTRSAYVQKSIRLGVDPEDVLATSAFTRDMPDATKTRIQNKVYNDASFYVNQSPNVAVKMMSKVTDPEQAVKIVNNNKVSPAARAAILGELKLSDSEIKPQVRKALRGNSKLAIERSIQDLQGALEDITKETKKASKFAKAAGEKSA